MTTVETEREIPKGLDEPGGGGTFGSGR